MRNRYGYDPEDPNNIDEGGFTPIPPGRYDLQVTEMKERQTRAGGLSLSLTARVVGPSSAGRLVFDNFNIQNANPKAQEIGLRRLHSLSMCSGVRKDWQELSEFAGLTFGGDIEQEDQGQYGIRNKIRRFHKTGLSQPGPAVPQAVPVPPGPGDDPAVPF